MSPIFQSGIRFVAVLGVEWSTLTLIEPAPPWVKITILALGVAVLGTLEFRSWLLRQRRWIFTSLLGSLIAVYVAIFGLSIFWAGIERPEANSVLPWLSAAFGVLGVAIAIYTVIKAQNLPSPTALAMPAPDTQTHLDVIHLLTFAVSEAAFWVIDGLLDLSEAPEITDGFENGPNTEEAHKSREYFVNYVRQQLGPGTFRQSDFINLMHTAQGEAERELEQTPQEKRPTDIDLLVLRKYKISERQFWRATRFLRGQRRELKEKLGNSRHSLGERINAREKSGRG